MHRCHIPNVSGPVVELDDDQAHHITKVLRLSVGHHVVVFDGRGQEWLGRVAGVIRSRVTVELVESRRPLAEPSIALTLAVGLLKGDQMNDVIRDAVALGVVRIKPLTSDHTAVSRGGNFERARDRWQRVAVAAAMQCGRAVVPEVEAPTAFATCLRGTAGVVVMCVEPVPPPKPVLRDVARPSTATLLVGPEGGWSASEVEYAHQAGAVTLTLGPRTLRAALAPAVALSALWTTWGWD